MKIMMTVLLLLLAFVAHAEDQKGDELNKIILTINGESITISDMLSYASLRDGMPLSENPVEAQNQILNEMLTTIMLSQEAGRLGLEKEESTMRTLKFMRMNVLRDTLIERMMNNQSVSEEELEKAYAENYPVEPEIRYLVRHILVDDSSKAEEIISQLDEGAEFEALARELSTGPSGPEGGSLGWISPEIVVPAFAAAMLKLEKEQYTKAPVETEFGWHVILLEDVQEVEREEPPPLETVRAVLEQQIKALKVQSEIQQLRESISIETPEESMIQINRPDEAGSSE
ncbi:MAG: peptidylprolyl isomerase [Chromatiales bacterium]|jgi:peptidyl-prolyl cis-trans isomerase C